MLDCNASYAAAKSAQYKFHTVLRLRMQYCKVQYCKDAFPVAGRLLRP